MKKNRLGSAEVGSCICYGLMALLQVGWLAVLLTAGLLLTHLNGFGLDAQVGEGTLQLPKGQGGVALGSGTAVDHQDFHGNLLSNLFLLFIPGRQRFAGEHRK